MKITKEGKRFLVTSSLMLLAALNTGNNLIYLILALMCSLILLSVGMVKTNLSRLSLKVTVEPPVFSGEVVSSKVLIRNNKRFIPSYSVAMHFPEAEGPVYCALVPPGGAATAEMRLCFRNRGLHRFGDLSVASGFPFILVTHRRRIRASGEVLVYPALRDVGSIPEEYLQHAGGDKVKLSGAGEDLYALREYRYGDDWRRIHWKASAKTSALLVKEFTEHLLKKVTILVDNLDPHGIDVKKWGDGMPPDAEFEDVVSISASLARYFLERDYLVRVVSCKKVVSYGGGNEQLFKILDILALLKTEDQWGPVLGEREGPLILVLRSRHSALRGNVASGDVVIYAGDI